MCYLKKLDRTNNDLDSYPRNSVNLIFGELGLSFKMILVDLKFLTEVSSKAEEAGKAYKKHELNNQVV